MSKIDTKTRRILDFVKDWLTAVPHGGLQKIAETCKVDRATLSRMHDKENPNYHPRAGTLLRVLTEISGKFPLEIKDNILLSNLPIHGKGEIFNKLSRGLADLGESDVELVFKFLAILKNRGILNPAHFAVLTGSMSMLQKELVEKKGPEVFINPTTFKGDAANDELN